MAIYIQLSLAKKRKNGYIQSTVISQKNVKMAIYSQLQLVKNRLGERTGLVVRALDSGSGDPGSILGRVGVLFP